MYEFHISVPRDTPIQKFKDDCEAFDIKYAILSLSNGQLDLMTSIKAKSWLEIRRPLELFPSRTRTKIECMPTTNYRALYYEAHFDGFIPGLPWAVNIVKKTPLISSTLRQYNISLEDFTHNTCVIANMNNLPRPDIEQIIYDSNQSWDDEWITPGVRWDRNRGLDL